MRKLLGGFIAVLLFSFPIQVSASEVGFDQCPDPTRPIHWLPYCFSQDELRQFLATQYETFTPTPVSVAPVDLVRTITYHFWPDWAAERMVRIAECESGYSPTAQHPGSKAAGLWQIMPFWQSAWPGDYFDPWTNGAVAYQIWLVQGFGAWVCRG